MSGTTNEVEAAADEITQVTGELVLRFQRHEGEDRLAADEPDFHVRLHAVLALLQHECTLTAEGAEVLTQLAIGFCGIAALREPCIVRLSLVRLVDVRDVGVLVEKLEGFVRAGKCKRRRRLQPVLAHQPQARVTIVLHAIGIAPAAEHRESLGAELLIFVNRVILIPDPDRVAPIGAPCHRLGERDTRYHPFANPSIAFLQPTVGRAGECEQHVVSFVLQAQGETEPCVLKSGDDESHALRVGVWPPIRRGYAEAISRCPRPRASTRQLRSTVAPRTPYTRSLR